MLWPIVIDIAITIAAIAGLWVWVLVVPPRAVRVRTLHVPGAKGLALPGYVLIAQDWWDDEGVVRHELEHLAQMRRYSPLGVAMMLGWHYGVATFALRLRTGRWPSFKERWESNPLEQGAIRAMAATGPLPPVRGWARPE